MGTRQPKKSEQRRINNPSAAVAAPEHTGTRHRSGLTESMHLALHWLKDHSGSGVRCKPYRMLAGGEYAPFMFETYERLKLMGLVSIEGFRWVITPKGREYLHKWPQ